MNNGFLPARLLAPCGAPLRRLHWSLLHDPHGREPMEALRYE